jgi:thymidylate synthase (FAD)
MFDHQKVRVIGVTKPVVDDMETSGQMLAFCARVSATANQSNHATGPKLIASLIKRQEWSPLEMVSATLEIETTRDIARQMLRHRSFSFQEFSQRYAVVDDEPVFRQCRMQHPTDRQSSVVCGDPQKDVLWGWAQDRSARHAIWSYKWALENGIAKEQARALLPEGMTRSRLYMAGTVRSWVHYIALRSANGTQLEHQDIAIKCAAALRPHFPELEAVL